MLCNFILLIKTHRRRDRCSRADKLAQHIGLLPIPQKKSQHEVHKARHNIINTNRINDLPEFKTACRFHDIFLSIALRGLIAYFFHRAAKHRDHAENQAKLLDNILATDTSLTPEERDKIERKKIKLQETAANIDRKIFKADKAAKEDMRKESAAIAKAMTDDSGFVGVTTPGTASNATPSPDSDDFVIL